MFRKVLIANRGEIAVRVIRACRDLGISPVAVFSDPDRASLHVRLADEAYPLNGAASEETYLSIEKILDVARGCGAEAIHPGYGFLSENPSFARACERAGIAFVGPSSTSMQLMGSKTGARSVLVRSGVKVVPGTYAALASVQEAAEEAHRIGYPVMIKAAAGGGGKGMRLVEEEGRLAADFEIARSEAQRAFGDASVYLEKYVRRPRHIEIQVLADHHGKAIYLGERECSVQRRHQKVVEESPSPLVDPDLRRRMGEAALLVVRSAEYHNAGTVEFLVDEDHSFYFLEMNTRLQVEHPVTEMVTGIDLVREQFRVAAGERLSLNQADVRISGWAIECRIYAEDPERNFAPCPGVIRSLVEPHGPGVRLDSGVYSGWEVPLHYDPLIAKLVAWGSDRREAIARMKRALAEYRVEGIRTTVGFFSGLLSDPEYAAGRLSTQFVEEYVARRNSEVAEPDGALSQASAIAAVLAYRDVKTPTQSSLPRSSAWKLSVRPRPPGQANPRS